mgnify:FL=1
MLFIESRIFTRFLNDYLNDDEYRELQAHLADNPEAGDIIPRSGGIRKVRWGGSGRGKRGGTRIIYYWQVPDSEIYLLTLYSKGEMSDLSAKELEVLKRMVETWRQ